MSEFCDFHPGTIAQWNCPKCDAMICSDCVTKREKGGYRKGELLHLCPKCNIPVQWLGVEKVIEPFWNRLPEIFRYPFFFQPLILMVILSVVSWFLSGPGIFKLLARGATFLVILKYSFELLKTTAGGNLKPPAINSQTISDDYQQVFKQFGLFLVISFASGWINFRFGRTAGSIFGILAYFFIPSMIILLVTTGSLLHALNPMLFVRLVLRIGSGYFLMYFFLMLLASAPFYLGQYVIQYFPANLYPLLFHFAQSYYTIIAYHLMGYVILQNHEKIGYKVDYDDFVDPTQKSNTKIASDPDAAVLNEVSLLIQSGNIDASISLIQDHMRGQRIASAELSGRYYQLLKMKKMPVKMVKHGSDYLALLVNGKKKQTALEVFSECRKIDSGFLPAADTLFKIAEWVNETGKPRESIELFSRLVKVYPNNPLVPKAYFRAAQIFHDRLMKPDKAKKILSSIIRQYPDDDITPQVKKYMATLQH